MLTTHTFSIPMATLGEISDTGPTHHTIGYAKGSEPMGAFEWTSLADLEATPSQQSLWVANSRTQKTITAEATHGGTIVDRGLAKQMVQTRSQWFLSRNLRWTSQALAMVRTTKPVHGGRAWNAIQRLEDDIGQCIALYYNSIFGAIVRNAYGQSTQAGRAPIQIGAIAGLPCPNFGGDTPASIHARAVADRHFLELSTKPLQPFAYCFSDKHRHAIDSVVAEMLGLNSDDEAVQELLRHYRGLFTREPSVHGRQRRILKAIEKHSKSMLKNT